MSAGSGLTTRAPGLSSRVKHACKLSNFECLASLKSKSLNKRQTAMDDLTTQGCRIWLHQPMNRVRVMRGMRLVSKKFRSSCSIHFWKSCRIFIMLSLNLNKKKFH